MKVELHIERLVLDGLPIAQRQGPQVQAAVAQELTRLLGEGGSPAGWRNGAALASLDLGTLQLSPGSDATGLGRQIAATLHGGLGERR